MVRGGFLLDTHVVYWLVLNAERVPAGVRAQLEDSEFLCVSALSSYELAFKHSFGKLPEAAGMLAHWQEFLKELMAEQLPITPVEMERAGSLRWRHRDPFDRMLVAQAQTHGLQIVTKDESILAYPEANCVPWE